MTKISLYDIFSPYGENCIYSENYEVKMKEEEIIYILPQKLRELVPELEVLEHEVGVSFGGSERYDLLLNVRIDQVTRKLLCEVKSVGEPRYLYQAISQISTVAAEVPDISPIIVAPYISEEGRRLCREAQVGYVDLTGNVFLRFDNVLIDKSGEGLVPRDRRALKRLFAPVSSRIVRVLLENPGKVWTFQGLAQESEASLGLTYRVVDALNEKGYVDKKRGATSLLRPGELLDLWAQNYNIDINPSQTFYSFARSFSSFIDKLRDVAQKGQFRYALTLHSGASKVAPFVRFTDVHFYYQGDLETIVEGLDLRPVEVGGTIHILTPYDEGVFYNLQRIDDVFVVCNTQLYLDLVNYPARGKEQADFLREQKISF